MKNLVWFSILPLLLSTGLEMIAHHPNPSEGANTAMFILVLVTIQWLSIAKGSGSAPIGKILGVSAWGSLGMALGAMIEHRQRMSCCMSVFNIGQLLSWPTIMMFLFCLAGSRAWHNQHGQIKHAHVRCGWTSLPAMYVGMCLAGRYLSPLMTPVFGLFLAMHWAMLIGMTFGHYVEFLAIRTFQHSFGKFFRRFPTILPP